MCIRASSPLPQFHSTSLPNRVMRTKCVLHPASYCSIDVRMCASPYLLSENPRHEYDGAEVGHPVPIQRSVSKATVDVPEEHVSTTRMLPVGATLQRGIIVAGVSGYGGGDERSQWDDFRPLGTKCSDPMPPRSRNRSTLAYTHTPKSRSTVSRRPTPVGTPQPSDWLYVL